MKNIIVKFDKEVIDRKKVEEKNIGWSYDIRKAGQRRPEKFGLAVQLTDARKLAEDEDWVYILVNDEKERQALIEAGAVISDFGIWAVPKDGLIEVLGAGIVLKYKDNGVKKKVHRVVRQSGSGRVRQGRLSNYVRGSRTVQGIVAMLVDIDEEFAHQAGKILMEGSADEIEALILKVKDVVDDLYVRNRVVSKCKYVMKIRGLR